MANLRDGQIEFAIWMNDNKEIETHADMKGTAKDSDGNEYWVNAWKRGEDANPNAPIAKGYLTPKDPKPNKPVKSTKTEEDIPW
jgi:hypothetical protein